MFKSSIPFMLLTSLLLNLSSNAVTLRRDKSTIYNIIAFLILVLTYILYFFLFLNLWSQSVITYCKSTAIKCCKSTVYNIYNSIIIGFMFNPSHLINLSSLFAIILFNI